MKNWKDKLILFIAILCVILSIFLYIKIADFNSDDIILNKIEELELKIDSINNKKDSIRSVIDSTHIKIITNEKHYQEKVNTIIYQSSSDDSSYVSDYIKPYANKNSLFDFGGTREIK